MAEEITVQLFPPTPVGLRLLQTPQGAIPVPEPCYQYSNVRDMEIDVDGVITFSTRQGDRIESNLKYLVKREMKAEGDA